MLQLQFCLPGPVVTSAVSERTFKEWFFMQLRSLLQEHERDSVLVLYKPEILWFSAFCFTFSCSPVTFHFL